MSERAAKRRVSPAMAAALLAIVVAASGGAYAASSTSSKTIAACVRHHGGTVYVAKKCQRRDKRLTWNTTGPRGATGATGNQGAQGVQGAPGATGATGTPDPSQFYDRATSDARFVQGGGRVIPIPAVSLANLQKGTIIDVPGVGTVQSMMCALSDSNYRYTNTTSSNETVVISNQLQAINNQQPISKALAPTAFTEDNQNNGIDIERFSVAVGTTAVAEFSITQTHDASLNCLYWGEVYVG